MQPWAGKQACEDTRTYNFFRPKYIHTSASYTNNPNGGIHVLNIEFITYISSDAGN
jgi:hypothetical protein